MRRPWNLALLVGLAACAGGRSTRAELEGDASRAGDDIVYDCYGVRTTVDELESATPVADLEDHPGLAAFAAGTDRLDRWRAVVVEDDAIAAIRARDSPDVIDGYVRDYERRVVRRIAADALPDFDEARWMVSSAGPCALRADLGDLGAANVFLNETGVDPRASTIELLVIEQACNSGQGAAGRVSVQVETDVDEIRLVVGVKPRAGPQTCPSNPPTPFTVELDGPIGDRRVVDASRYPTREIEPKG